MELRSGDGWFHFDKNLKKEIRVAPYMDVTQKMKIEETGEHLIRIESNHKAEYTGKMGILSHTKIDELMNFGFAITPENKLLLSQALMENAFQLPLETLYESVGIIKRENQFRFHC